MAANGRRRLPPTDDSGSDPGFARFLAALRAAARTENESALRALCAGDVITGIDMPPGPDELLQQMRTGGWAVLRGVLAFGAGRYDGGFVLPYLFAQFPEDLEATEHVVAVRAGAVLRSAADPGARVVCPLHFDVLHTGSARVRNGWIRASRLDGHSGWAAEADVRGLGEPRLFSEKRMGHWQWTAWASGS